MIILVPVRFDIQYVTSFLQYLQSYGNLPEQIVLDFSQLTFARPFATLAIGSGLRYLVKKRKSQNFQTTVTGYNIRDVHSYLSFVGFYDYIMLPVGHVMGQAAGSLSYTPITPLNRAALFGRTSPPYRELRHVIFEESHRLARLFSSTSANENSINTIAYSIREIIRNVFEHSSSDTCYIFGQRYRNGSVEIGIIDEGVGVRESLSSAHNISSDAHALELAIQPGVSRVQNLNTNNINDNSGFGLYILSRLGGDYGWFAIGSGTSQIISQGNNLSLQNTLFNGTYVGLQLNSDPIDFEDTLNNIIHDGEVEAHVMGRNVCASSSSRFTF